MVQQETRKRDRKIRMLASHHPPFSGRIFAKEAKSLSCIYEDVGIIVPWDHHDAIVDGVRILALRCTKRRIVKRFCRLGKLFWRAWCERPAVYHCHELDSLFVGVLLKWLRGGKLIFDCHEYHPEKIASLFPSRLQSVVRRFVEILERTMSQASDAVIVVNDHMAAKFRHFHHQVVVVPNYPRRSFMTNVQALPKEKNLSLVYIGSLSAERGVEEMIRVVKKLQASVPGVQLWILGRFADPNYKASIKCLLADLNVEDAVVMPGRVPFEEVPTFLRRAHIGLFLLHATNPAHHWGEPMKFFEYSAAGLPIVISDLPAKRKLVERAQNGVLVTPTDIDEIAQVVLALWNDLQKRVEMGRQGRQAFMETFNWQVVEPRLLSLYHNLIDQ